MSHATTDRVDTQGWHRIRIALPLPLALSGSIISAIGTMWPGTMIDQSEGGRYLTLVVPKVNEKKVKRALAKIGSEQQAEVMETLNDLLDAQVTRCDGENFVVSTPASATHVVAEAAFTMLTASPEAVNYVEQTVTLPEPVRGPDGKDHRRLAIGVCWSPAQTPHELRIKAEARADEAEARAAQLEALLNRNGIELP